MKILTDSPQDYEIFRDIYKEFQKEPFWEKWTEELFREVFDEYTRDAICFVYDEGNVAKGMLAVTFNKRDDRPKEIVGDKIAYFADIVVKREYRGQGIGTKLQEYALDFVEKFCSPDAVYFRTNFKGSMSEGIARKIGFEIVKDENGETVTQDCYFERSRPDVPSVDKRKFLVRSCKNEYRKDVSEIQ